MKVLITESTQVNHGDDRGAVHVDAGEVVDMNKENARIITTIGRGLYVAKADDPNKDGRLTASPEILKAAKDLAAAKAAEADKKG